MSSSTPRLAVFIDGISLYAAAKALGFDVDYRRLLTEFQRRGALLRALYYNVVIEEQEYTAIRPLIDWLDYNGYTVVTKVAKDGTAPDAGRRPRGSLEVELAVDAMQLAVRIDEMILVSGNGDFRALVAAMQRRGVKVHVMSTIATHSPMIGGELRRQADLFTDLNDLKGAIARVQPN